MVQDIYSKCTFGFMQKNSIVIGLLIALVFPALAFVAAHFLKYNDYIITKPLLPYLSAIALNLFVLRYCLKKELGETVKGVIATTFLFMLLLFIFKTHLP